MTDLKSNNCVEDGGVTATNKEDDARTVSSTNLSVTKPCSPTNSSATSPNIKGCSNKKAVYSVVMTSIGLGVLELPNAVANAGWFGGIFIQLLSFTVCSYLTLRLYQALTMQKDGKLITSFESLGEYCFGIVGKIVAALCLDLTMMGLLAVTIILIGKNMNRLVPSISQNVWGAIFVAIFLPMSWIRHMRHVGTIAGLGILSVIIIMVIIIFSGISKFITEPDCEGCEHSLIGDSIPKMFGSFCVILLSYTVSPTTATIVKDMARPYDYPKVNIAAYACIFTVYTLVGFAGYLGYGNIFLTTDSAMETIAPENEEFTIIGYFIIGSCILMVCCHYLVLYSPLGAGSDRIVESICYSSNVRHAYRQVAYISCRTIIVLLSAMLAFKVPHILALVSLIAALLVTWMAILLPVSFYWRMRQIYYDSNSIKVLYEGRIGFFIFEFCIFIFGMISWILGTNSAVSCFVDTMN